MNKTLMLVICDFLLLSMLALARFDPPEEPPEATLNATASSATTEAELIELLEESLQSEQESRSNLSQDLNAARESLQNQTRVLEAREQALNETKEALEAKSSEAQNLAQTKAELEAEQTRMAEEKAAIDAERTELAQKYESTRTRLESATAEKVEIVQTLGQLKSESSLTRERLTKTEEELAAREIALAEKEAALKAAEAEKSRLASEREQLNRQLEVAMAEQKLLNDNLSRAEQEKTQLREERAQANARAERLGENVSTLGQNVSQLGEGVSTLTQTSEDIKKEIVESRPQTMSEIFTRFQKNRGTIRFTSNEKTLFGGQTQRSYESKSILVADTQGTYLVTHSADTPFSFSKPAGSVIAADVEIDLAGRKFPVRQIGFFSTDPRLIFIPLPETYVSASGLEIFQLAMQPERWEEAVLIKNDESNFGRTGFRRLTSSEKFLKMDRPALGELLADFASSRGDLAFTKNSRFIGVLTDTSHAVVIDAFLASAVLNVGKDFNPTEAAATIKRLEARVQKLPTDVQ
ncbi:hypothetical protein [Coraliomargarita parva]|uniref:hypothetical protein n=1 Tax=Coraliomargarita parva TaxID=3014050 RepID=UPI0022B34D45|nr:hypothetical protein [Coraliomargarita parva]